MICSTESTSLRSEETEDGSLEKISRKKEMGSM